MSFFLICKLWEVGFVWEGEHRFEISPKRISLRLPAHNHGSLKLYKFKQVHYQLTSVTHVWQWQRWLRFSTTYFLLDMVLFNAAFSRGCYYLLHCVKKDNQCSSANVFHFLLDYAGYLDIEPEPGIIPAHSRLQVLYNIILNFSKSVL